LTAWNDVDASPGIRALAIDEPLVLVQRSGSGGASLSSGEYPEPGHTADAALGLISERLVLLPVQQLRDLGAVVHVAAVALKL
jgi:hypothetical protein